MTPQTLYMRRLRAERAGRSTAKFPRRVRVTKPARPYEPGHRCAPLSTPSTGSTPSTLDHFLAARGLAPSTPL